ncbi:MAG: hypothetical protein V1843_00595 [bacterium]
MAIYSQYAQATGDSYGLKFDIVFWQTLPFAFISAYVVERALLSASGQANASNNFSFSLSLATIISLWNAHNYAREGSAEAAAD